MVEEWVQDARNEARVEADSHAETKKSLGDLKQEQTGLSNNLIGTNKARLSVEVGLKNAEIQVEDQCKQLHMTEIELAT